MRFLRPLRIGTLVDDDGHLLDAQAAQKRLFRYFDIEVNRPRKKWDIVSENDNRNASLSSHVCIFLL
jgi:hypothetical protein